MKFSGNALLLGQCGSGRSSVVVMAAELLGYELYIMRPVKYIYTQSEFLNDLKQVSLKAGVENRPVIYMVSEEYMTPDMLDRIDDFLRTGTSPILLNSEELERVIQDVRINSLMRGNIFFL